MEGYTGAHPSPIMIRPISANILLPKGIPTMMIPAEITRIPDLISLLSPILSDTNPLINLPNVIPI
jgi:hypothetical protein